MKDLLFVDEQINDLSFTVKEGEQARLSFANFTSARDTEIKIDVEKNASLIGALADFSKGKSRFKLTVNLLGEGSSCQWRSAVLAGGESDKVISTSLYHLAPETSGVMSNYGISMDKAKLVFTGTSEIAKGSKKAKTRQEAKIIVFDMGCMGRCTPNLNIDENDVSASHAAIVGKLNDDHLFYLLSRGLDEKSAKRLITLGYLKPIEEFFGDEGIKNRIDQTIEGDI
ncbi:MAG: SufD family Fe-S cluster assembly protein [Bacillota bacterium]|nr:SufD family Fe-S cluster assembly protein [Bacillota bacterium]